MRCCLIGGWGNFYHGTVSLSIKILKKGLFYFSQKEEKQEEAKTEKEKNKETKPALFFIC